MNFRTFRTEFVAVAASAVVAAAVAGASSEVGVGLALSKLQDRYPVVGAAEPSGDERAALRPALRRIEPTSTPKGDRINAADADCAAHVWPKIPTSCLTSGKYSMASTPSSDELKPNAAVNR